MVDHCKPASSLYPKHGTFATMQDISTTQQHLHTQPDCYQTTAMHDISRCWKCAGGKSERSALEAARVQQDDARVRQSGTRKDWPRARLPAFFNGEPTDVKPGVPGS